MSLIPLFSTFCMVALAGCTVASAYSLTLIWVYYFFTFVACCTIAFYICCTLYCCFDLSFNHCLVFCLLHLLHVALAGCAVHLLHGRLNWLYCCFDLFFNPSLGFLCSCFDLSLSPSLGLLSLTFSACL